MSEEEEQGGGSTQSALRENISRKGQNSYYYGHATVRDGPAWDGKEEPRLLAVESVPVAATSARLASSFDSYSWGNEKKAVKVYIDMEGASAVADDNISLETTPTSLTFTLTNVNGGKDYKLFLSPLSKEITGATYKKKDSMFVLSLVKAEETAWYDLIKK